MMAPPTPEALFMHCLPGPSAARKCTDGVIEGPHSVVWDEAENSPARSQKGAARILLVGPLRSERPRQILPIARALRRRCPPDSLVDGVHRVARRSDASRRCTSAAGSPRTGGPRRPAACIDPERLGYPRSPKRAGPDVEIEDSASELR
jgi:hypothetical protein